MAKKRKRKRYEVIEGIQCALEKRGSLNLDYGIPIGGWDMPDKDFSYRNRGINKVVYGIEMSILTVLAPIVIKVYYGAKVTGRDNMKELKGKGAICVCNHFSFLDTLFVRQAMGYFRSYHTSAPYNNKNGVGGYIIKRAAMLPFSSDYAAMRNLSTEMERLLKKGKIINFYAEEAMWHSYQKPRPMRIGAFHYAVKYSVPVVPIFCTFERTKKGRIKRLRINILKPVYGNEALPLKQRSAEMKNLAEKEWAECYSKNYGG